MKLSIWQDQGPYHLFFIIKSYILLFSQLISFHSVFVYDTCLENLAHNEVLSTKLKR